VEPLKILGIRFKASLNNTAKTNFDLLIATVSFMFKSNSIRNLNSIQKVWTNNTFILLKLWFVSQVITAGNQQIAQVKRIIGNFLWAGHMHRIDRRQLWLSRKEGGQFLKNVMLKKINGIVTLHPDQHLTCDSKQQDSPGTSKMMDKFE
jgi:hypothetical protein